MTRRHGGPDSLGVPAWDFSTNANAAGPCPQALEALALADATRYPDPVYASLRAALAGFHGVAPARIVIAASASEFITRMTAALVRAGLQAAWWPRPGYGDYAQAAGAWGLARAPAPAEAGLLWLCEPASPQGGAEAMAREALAGQGVVVLDRAYEPLRLGGRSSFDEEAAARLWQLWSPNKALGLTGVRGAYAIAPPRSHPLAAALDALAPSWPLGAHAVAMLQAWVAPGTQQWLAGCRERLADWKAQQLAMLQALGWQCLPGDANFICARPPGPLDAAALRARGIKLRDTESMGLPGHWRLGVQPPAAQAALRAALHALQGKTP